MISRVRLAKMEDSYGVVEGQFDDAVDAGPCRCDTVDVNMYESNETFVMLFLSVFTPGKLKSLLDRGGNRTSDLWFASPILYPVWKVCIARRISPARNFDAFYIITIKFLKSPARNFQTFQSGTLPTELRAQVGSSGQISSRFADLFCEGGRVEG
jgi:hypothetical protein